MIASLQGDGVTKRDSVPSIKGQRETLLPCRKNRTKSCAIPLQAIPIYEFPFSTVS